MAKDVFIKYEGNNDELFTKKCVDSYEVDTKLIVPETHNAIIIKDGIMMETLFSGSYEIFDKKKGLFKDKKEGLTVDVVFMSKTAKLRFLWGTRCPFEFKDLYTGVLTKIGCNGEAEVQIENPRKFYLEVIGNEKDFTIDKLKSRLVARMLIELENVVVSTIRGQKITVDRIGEYKKQISDRLLPLLQRMFSADYGIRLCTYTVAQIIIDEKFKKAIEDVLKGNIRLPSSDSEEAKEQSVTKGLISCPECGEKFTPDNNFCNKCGAKLKDSKKKCPTCLFENASGSNFCSKCGTKI